MSIERVREYFRSYGIEGRIQEFEVSSATVELAAQALHCKGQRIAKTLSFHLGESVILIVAAGDAKVDNAKYKGLFGTKAKMLSFEEAEPLIGHAVGGVCPFAVKEGVKVYLDVSLKRFETVFPACGSSNSAIELTLEELEKYSGYVEWVDVCKIVEEEVKKIRWGIVGPGVIANKFARAIGNVDGAQLTAVAARNREKGQVFADTYGIPNVFGSYEEMAGSDLVDAVYIATPHPFHKPCAELFLKAGKHVLCEKPVCVNAAQAMALKKCAQENGVFLMEAMWTRFLPAIREAKALVEGGAIGDVLGVRADFCYASTPQEDGKLYQNQLAGGSLLDVGVYGLHFAAMFLGNRPRSIVSAARVADGVDHHMQVLLQYENGALASVSSAISLYKPEEAYVYGTKGYLYLPQFYGAQELYLYADGQEQHISKPSIGEGFEEEIYEACACIREGRKESDILPMDESIEVLKWMDEVRRQTGIRYPLEGEENHRTE